MVQYVLYVCKRICIRRTSSLRNMYMPTLTICSLKKRYRAPFGVSCHFPVVNNERDCIAHYNVAFECAIDNSNAIMKKNLCKSDDEMPGCSSYSRSRANQIRPGQDEPETAAENTVHYSSSPVNNSKTRTL